MAGRADRARGAGRVMAGWLCALYLLWVACVVALALFSRDWRSDPDNAFDVFYGLIAVFVIATAACAGLLGGAIWCLKTLRRPLRPSAKQYALTVFLPFTFLWMFPRENAR